jgi:hypothetical protein
MYPLHEITNMSLLGFICQALIVLQFFDIKSHPHKLHTSIIMDTLYFLYLLSLYHFHYDVFLLVYTYILLMLVNSWPLIIVMEA